MSNIDNNGGLRSDHTIIFVLFGLIFILLIALIFCISIISADPVLVENVGRGEKLDVIQVAVALGRLDAITLLMTLVTVGIGIVAVFGYREIKKNAAIKASEVSEKIAKRIAKEVARDIASKEIRAVYGATRTTGKTAEIDALTRIIAEKNSMEDNGKIDFHKFKTSGNVDEETDL